MQSQINVELAAKVLTVVDAGLCSGKGRPIPGQMCVEAAVCYAMGLPHGDNPSCVAPALRSLKIRLNDSLWTSDQARAKGLRRLAIAQLGSAGALDEGEFSRRVCSLALRTSVPNGLRAVAGLFRDRTATKERLLTVAALCEQVPTHPIADELRAIAKQLMSVADAAAAAAAVAVAHSAFWDAYWKARNAGSVKRDQAMADFCEGVVKILIEMKAPGCEFLHLTEV